jgi:hypothetical protein
LTNEDHEKLQSFLNHYCSLLDVPDHLFLTKDKAFTTDKIKAGKNVTKQ